MNVREVIEIFDQMYDKYRDEGILETEKILHLNTAAMNVVRREYAQEFEKGSTMSERWNDLLVSNVVLRPDQRGRVSKSTLEEYLVDDIVRDRTGNIISAGKVEMLGIARMQRWDGKQWWPVAFVKLNDWWDVVRDPFEKPTNEYPKYLNEESYIVVHPVDQLDIKLDIVRFPRHMYKAADPSEDVHLDVSGSLAMDIILEALKYAGIHLRDQELYEYGQREVNVNEIEGRR